MFCCLTNAKQHKTGSLIAYDKILIPLFNYEGLKDKYALVEKLSGSLYGEVYKGKCLMTGMNVAIKISSKKLLNKHQSIHNVEVLEDVVNEVKILNIIKNNHLILHNDYPCTKDCPLSGIISLVEEIKDDDFHYIITELVTDEYGNSLSLFDKISNLNKPLSETISKDIAKQLFKSVQYLHNNDIVHLDLSLENIVFSSTDNIVKIIDFGVARIRDTGYTGDKFPFDAINKDNHRPGKQLYMSYELWNREKWDAFANDTFSLGVILYCIVVGHPPFMFQNDKFATTLKKSKEDFSRWHKNFIKHLSEPCIDLLSKLLCSEKDRISINNALNHEWMLQ
jgi:serine/threonine protein kinase